MTKLVSFISFITIILLMGLACSSIESNSPADFDNYEANSHSEDNIIRLICKYSDPPEVTKTPDAFLVIIKYKDDGTAIIDTDSREGDFIGKITESEIIGETVSDISHRTIIINRYTGAFKTSLRFVGSEVEYPLSGTCEPAEAKF